MNAIAFRTPFFGVLCSNHALVEEFVIDSTYKTNREGSELFGVIANVNGAGFPVAYLLVDTRLAPDHAITPKTIILESFMRSLSSMGMSPAFMHSDKDAAQMEAITRVWGNNCLRLCTWHMRRAVDRKLQSNKAATPPVVFQVSIHSILSIKYKKTSQVPQRLRPLHKRTSQVPFPYTMSPINSIHHLVYPTHSPYVKSHH